MARTWLRVNRVTPEGEVEQVHLNRDQVHWVRSAKQEDVEKWAEWRRYTDYSLIHMVDDSEMLVADSEWHITSQGEIPQ